MKFVHTGPISDIIRSFSVIDTYQKFYPDNEVHYFISNKEAYEFLKEFVSPKISSFNILENDLDEFVDLSQIYNRPFRSERSIYRNYHELLSLPYPSKIEGFLDFRVIPGREYDIPNILFARSLKYQDSGIDKWKELYKKIKELKRTVGFIGTKLEYQSFKRNIAREEVSHRFIDLQANQIAYVLKYASRVITNDSVILAIVQAIDKPCDIEIDTGDISGIIY